MAKTWSMRWYKPYQHDVKILLWMWIDRYKCRREIQMCIRAMVTSDIYVRVRISFDVMWVYVQMVEARMNAAHKIEVEKLLYAALVSADTTRDWPNCSRVWNVCDHPCRVPSATRTAKSINVFDFWRSASSGQCSSWSALEWLVFSWYPFELILSTFAHIIGIAVSSTFLNL